MGATTVIVEHRRCSGVATAFEDTGAMTNTARRAAASIEELTAGATDRIAVRTLDAKSGARFERLTIGGQPHFLKVLSAADDWIMRVTGNTTNWELQVWEAGLYDQVPGVIDHTIVGMAREGDGPAARLAILMTDCADDLVPSGDTRIGEAQHYRFVDHMAAFHATFMGWRDDIGLQDRTRRFMFFAPATIAPELGADDVPEPIAVADRGWRLLPERSPALDELVRRVHDDPAALATALDATPATFVAGDWKLGNLGSRADGRTVLLDWAYPGQAPPCWELAWYLALNRARLPESKEATIARYREALERHQVDTGGWWDRQLGLCLVGIMATFAWEKAVGDADELAWWEAAANNAAAAWW
jgi:hypothetical protein